MRHYNSHNIHFGSQLICGGMLVYRGWFSGSCENDTEG